ncbi:MAG: prephenate dehydrogenase/arogenate dehydrogenase family protein, partial [Methyloprofundus sp.]|nr:prephenate dehydrogenase/arogenate dehydrogenase family protein [Methyloprofundus sp.]
MFNKLCIIGVGLIGGSVARTARKNGVCQTISAYGREQDLANLQRAQELQVIDTYSLDLQEAVFGADCVIIATPVGATAAIIQQLAENWSVDTLYMDVGSTKGNIVLALEQVFGFQPPNFVPAHPIAGAEKSGVEAALDDLFLNKRLILTPDTATGSGFLQQATAFWKKLGSVVSIMPVEQHDAVLAATSHLPHILAFGLVDVVGKNDATGDILKYAAGGFKDFTRIASSDPTMWLDICMANKQHLIPLIEQLSTELEDIKQMLVQNNAQQLHQTFTDARNTRQRFLALN